MPNPQDDQVHQPDQQQIDPGDLSGQQSPPKKEPPKQTADELARERTRLEAMQSNTKDQAEAVAAEALAVILAMGWTFGARVTDKGPEFCIVPLPLEMFQDVNREMLRNQLMNPLGR